MTNPIKAIIQYFARKNAIRAEVRAMKNRIQTLAKGPQPVFDAWKKSVSDQCGSNDLLIIKVAEETRRRALATE